MKHLVSNHTKALSRKPSHRPDSQVARRRRSRRSGSRRVKAGSAYFWTAEEERLLAQTMKESRNRHATRELAKWLDRSQVAVETHRRVKFGRLQRAPRAWTRREDRLLGTRTDAEVARLTSRHPSTVKKRRSRLGIPSTVERRPWTPKEDRLLGTASDAALAKKLGRSHSPPQGVEALAGPDAGRSAGPGSGAPSGPLTDLRSDAAASQGSAPASTGN